MKGGEGKGKEGKDSIIHHEIIPLFASRDAVSKVSKTSTVPGQVLHSNTESL
jgi:hypothetical protein